MKHHTLSGVSIQRNACKEVRNKRSTSTRATTQETQLTYIITVATAKTPWAAPEGGTVAPVPLFLPPPTPLHPPRKILMVMPRWDLLNVIFARQHRYRWGVFVFPNTKKRAKLRFPLHVQKLSFSFKGALPSSLTPDQGLCSAPEPRCIF